MTGTGFTTVPVFFTADAAVGRIGQVGNEGVAVAFGDFKGEGHVGGKGPVGDEDAVTFGKALEGADQGVGDGRRKEGEGRVDDDGRFVEGQGRSVAVSPDEAAGAEFDAAEIAGDDDGRVGQVPFL